MKISTGLLSFAIQEDGSHARFIIGEDPARVSDNSDFWRLILDDGFYTELVVHSHMQTGRVVPSGNGMTIEYDQLVSEYGDTFPIRFSVEITIEDGLFRFTPSIRNRTENVRVNECFCPLVELTQLCGEKEKDVLYMPFGLGERIIDPWGYMDSEAVIKDYYAHNETESTHFLYYPGEASMSWYGIESGGRFFYVAKHDPDHRCCHLTVRQTIHSDPTNLMLSINQFPMTRPGEDMTLQSVIAGLMEGDWRKGAQYYRAWADRSFYSVPEKPEWVRHMTGWQRLIMRSQWGHDFFKPEDLPEVYRIGAEHGMHAIFLFGWWKDGFDRNYPDAYDEPLDGMVENIRKVQDMGGHIILDILGTSIDGHSDFYRKQGGEEVTMLDINGNLPPQHYTFPWLGEFRNKHGRRWNVNCCSGSRRWRKKLMDIVRMLHGMGGHCAFIDTYGAHPLTPCFNDTHDHGPRVDEEWIGKTKFLKEALAYTEEQGMALGTEIVTDAVASYVHFIHGFFMNFEEDSDIFPAMFRYTFPEPIATLRGIRCSEGRFDRMFKSALTAGLRMDAELYVCRATVDRDPRYAAVVKWYTSKLTEYSEFFMDGSYTVLDGRFLPRHIKRGEYIDRTGTKVLRVLFNCSDNDEEHLGVRLAADEFRFDVFEKEKYLRILCMQE